eukprot:5002-Heterococcus_DN1.PRE.3
MIPALIAQYTVNMCLSVSLTAAVQRRIAVTACAHFQQFVCRATKATSKLGDISTVHWWICCHVT